jgi:hypothetical protein
MKNKTKLSVRFLEMSLIEFWNGAKHDVNMQSLSDKSIPVKGIVYRNPCRLIEIYGNTVNSGKLPSNLEYPCRSFKNIISECYPRIPEVIVRIGEGYYQPPFVWNDCAPSFIALNLTYTTNAIYRILINLAVIRMIPMNQVDAHLDNICMLLTHVYRNNGKNTIRWINNNINMYMISKVCEVYLGKNIYNSEYQETERTSLTLNSALTMAKEHVNLKPKQLMALAMGKGIAFLENYVTGNTLTSEVSKTVNEISYKYTENPLAIDDRDELLTRIYSSNEKGIDISMCMILDDTAESIDDLLWLQKLLDTCPYFYVYLLVNNAQVSINFASYMLEQVVNSETFSSLARHIGKRLKIIKTYCPLISYQSNFLDKNATNTLKKADIVFVKGLNFFETCQFPEKNVFHSFVVYGPVSRLYTGYNDFDGIFAFIPKGESGYKHDKNISKVVTLKTIHSHIKKTDDI